MMTCAWLWLYAGAGLMLLELLLPGFVVFFFGLSAFAVGMLKFVFGDVFTPAWQLAAFSGLSVFFLLGLRRWMKSVFLGKTESASMKCDDDVVGRVGTVTSGICRPLPGRVEIGDAQWSAIADNDIECGETVRVVQRENLTLKVERI